MKCNAKKYFKEQSNSIINGINWSMYKEGFVDCGAKAKYVIKFKICFLQINESKEEEEIINILCEECYKKQVDNLKNENIEYEESILCE